MENSGKTAVFSGRIWPDWGNTAWADMAGLGSIWLNWPNLVSRIYRSSSIKRIAASPIMNVAQPDSRLFIFDRLCYTVGGYIATKTLYHRDGALLYIAYVMLIWAAPIPADRWHCSLWPWLTHWVDWHAP